MSFEFRTCLCVKFFFFLNYFEKAICRLENERIRPNVHVPFIIRVPSQTRNGAFNSLVENI